MKNRSSLVLMEQLVMVLVFALAAAVCLGVFMKADRISRDTVRRDEAILVAQNGAEVLKSTAGDMEAAAGILGGSFCGNGLTAESGDYSLEIQLLDSGFSGLGQAEICVYLNDLLLFELRTGWQEVVP